MRKQLILGLGLILACAVVATPAQADDDLRATIRSEISKWAEANDDNTFKVYWKNGLNLSSGDVQMKIGGRLHIDHWFVDDDDFTAAGGPGVPDAAFESGAKIRRARLHNAGLLHGNVEWKLELDFANANDPEFRNAYIGLVNLDDCFGCIMPNIRVGQFKVPFGLEQLTSSNYITFMERSAATNTFTPGYRYGVMLHDVFRGGQLGYALGYFSGDSSFQDDGEIEFDGNGDGYGLAARVWWTPWYDCACSCRRLHVGAGIVSVDEITSIRFSNGGYVTTGNGANLIDTGAVAAQGAIIWNAELALVYGPWSLQGEYFSAAPDGSGDPTFSGWYVQGSYWLTGECRQYNNGVFTRTSPCCNFLENECCCYGGFELAGRYEQVDLTDGNFFGGELTGWTVGLNWHMNPNARIMINYFNLNIDNARHNNLIFNDVDTTGLGVRLQVDW